MDPTLILMFFSEKGKILKTYTISFKTDNSTDVMLYARYHSIPDNNNSYDHKGINSVTLIVPVKGLWLIYAYSMKPVNANIVISHDDCSNITAGNNCKEAIVNASSLALNFAMESKLKNQTIKYYAIYNKKVDNLIVSINRSSNVTNYPTMYASFNRVPLYNNSEMYGYDLNLCNIEYCNQIQSLNLMVSNSSEVNVTGTWYIAVKVNQDNTNYEIWFDYVCPNNCSQHGKCQSSSKDYGKCRCEQGFKGFMCSDSTFYIEYFILFVIATLILLSSLVGLICWAYRKRKQGRHYTNIN